MADARPPKGAPQQAPGLLVYLADVEVIAAFIAAVGEADATFKHMTPADAAVLPPRAVRGIQMVQGAVARLRRAGEQDTGLIRPDGRT